MSNEIRDWGSHLYNGASDVGTFKADLFMIIAVIIGFFMIAMGMYMVITDDSEKYIRVTGIVAQPNCVRSSVSYDDKGRAIDNYKCNLAIDYKINGKTYTKKMYLSGKSSYVKDEPVELVIDKSNYENVKLASMTSSMIGGTMMVSAIVLFGIAYLNYYLTHNYKVFAAAQGAETIVGLFR